MHGFKSFARKTEIPLENSMNVIVGPNGSGKSNITDALCFVLGRLSIKSIRAAKAANLLFTGNKIYKGSLEASVEIAFDNSNNTFSIDSKELVIKRIVRKNGLSIYKINNQTKTRQELLETLAQGGIDPNGFNIVLQGEIQSLVKATSEEKRKIIEEVAGISIYEIRKIKSIRELEKTEEKLKEVEAILKEKNSYLRNLDKERQEAMSFQKLEETIKKCKATLISKNIKEKEKEIWEVDKSIENHETENTKTKKEILEKRGKIEDLENKIKIISKKIQYSTDNEQDILLKEISDLKIELAGLNVRQENYTTRVNQGKEKIISLKEKIGALGEEISKIKANSPEIKKRHDKQKILSEKFDLLEKQRKEFYLVGSNVSSLETKKAETEKKQIELNKEIQLIKQNINSLYHELKYGKSISEIEDLKNKTSKHINILQEEFSNLEKDILEKEKRNAILEMDAKREEKLKIDIINLDTCPICKQNVEEGHKHKISVRADEKILEARREFEKNIDVQKKNKERLDSLKQKLYDLKHKLNELNIDEIKIKNSEEKNLQIKRIIENESGLKEEIKLLNEKLNKKRERFSKLKDVEERYDETRVELQELSFPDLDFDTETSVKQREQNRLTNELKSITRDIEDSETELEKINSIIIEKNKLLEKREDEERRLYEKFQKLFNEKNELQDQEKTIETEIIGLEHTIRNVEEKINHNKIQKAQYTAQIDSLKTELAEFGTIEIINEPLDKIREKLQKTQLKISGIGSINMRALEVFDEIKKQCDLIQEKYDTITSEKEKIIKIIYEIDKKKKKSFISTLNSVNSIFTRNFSQLSKKGEIFLELENKKEPFEGGLSIIVKTSRGKYFDVASLSGGEKAIVALALIFAIQEYKPYSFYIFDEIDAALDKHNSELLAALIKKHMTTGQYILITHNDTLISEATNLYGVSMQDNISKIVSLKV